MFDKNFTQNDFYYVQAIYIKLNINGSNKYSSGT